MDFSRRGFLRTTAASSLALAVASGMAGSPPRRARIKMIVAVDLPRPRDPFSPPAEALRRHLTAQLRDEVDRAFAEQETLSVR
jgi:NitT/TauT family transport system ATP-binding protein